MNTWRAETTFLNFILLLSLGACTPSEQTDETTVDPVEFDSNAIAEVEAPADTGVIYRDSILNNMRRLNHPRFHDFDSLLNRRLIRVLIPYSRTLYFNDKGRERGLTADLCRDFEIYLNRKYKRRLKNIPITLIFIPTTRNQLLSKLNEGLGDIAAGNITVTDERLKEADFFSSPDDLDVSEIPLSKKGADSLTSPQQLSGRTVHVRKSSSYYEHLLAFNKKLQTEGKPPINLVLVSEDLEDEDLMEMLNAGIFSTIIVDSWKARMWARILPGIHLNEGAAVHSGGRVGWALRKNSPKLMAELSVFYKEYVVRNGIIPYRLKRYAARVKQLQDPTNANNYERYSQIVRLFEKYGKVYDFDPLMLTALGFQESQLDQSRRSQVGAVGVMQLMPATGASMKVGSIYVTESNIHAGTKYMKQLVTVYFPDAHFDAFNRSLFAVASYNAGPGRVAGLRRAAAARGLNPDVWLDNVELIASEKVGQETTTYVRNILKYYYSYKLMQEKEQVQKQQREAF